MIRGIYLIGLLLLSFQLSAQWKVVDKSHKHKPSWVGGAERNYLIVSADAPTLEAAKEKLLISLKQQIVGTIATRIVAETNISRQQTTVGRESDYTENITSSVQAKVGRVPFVSEISLSKAKEYYWEKLYDKKKKAYLYEYHVKYLFTDFEIQELVSQFNEHENGLNVRLTAYTDELEKIESVEQIDRNINELKSLLQEFDRDDPRCMQTEQLTNMYRKLYSFLDLREEERPSLHTVSLGLYLRNRRIASLQKPQLLSNCASKLSYTINEGYYHISYDDTACYEQDENYLEIRFRFGNKITSKKVYLR